MAKMVGFPGTAAVAVTSFLALVGSPQSAMAQDSQRTNGE
jgi:hypothetical protein